MGLQARAKAELQQWLAAGDPDTLVTVTLKQAVLNEDGGLTRLTEADCDRATWLLRDRVTKALLGSRRFRSGERFSFVPHIEGGDGVTRRHLHIHLRRPEGVSLADVERAFASLVRRLDWTRPELDVRPIRQGEASCVVRYCLKEGADSFCPAGAQL